MSGAGCSRDETGVVLGCLSACLPALGINEVDCIESLMIAYESKTIIIFEELLLILSNFRSPFMQLFHKDCITCFSELYKQSFSVIDLYRTAYEL